jgi:hypothetical protein
MDIPTYSGRGPKVPNSVRNLIAEIYLKDRQQVAKEVMAEVHKRLQRKGRQLRSGWPGLSYVQKALTELRNKERELSLDPLDRPWSYISLAHSDYTISSDALPVVLKVWAYSLRKEKPLTIRQALWTARLYHVFNDKPLDKLWEAAATASYHEKVFNLLEEDGYPETREGLLWYWPEDAYLYGQIVGENRATDIVNMIQDEFGKLPVAREIAIWEIAEKYNADPVKLKDLNLSIEETEDIAKSGKYKKEA